MRQNGATSAPFFYCVSYEILCETRIKPGFFGNCLISLSSALGPSAWALNSRGLHPRQFAPWAARSARAHQENSARARRGRVGPLSRLAATASRLLALSVTATPCQLPQRGSQVGSSPEACRKPSLASPFGGGALQRRAERATALPSGKGAGNQRLPGCFPSFLSCAARL